MEFKFLRTLFFSSSTSTNPLKKCKRTDTKKKAQTTHQTHKRIKLSIKSRHVRIRQHHKQKTPTQPAEPFKQKGGGVRANTNENETPVGFLGALHTAEKLAHEIDGRNVGQIGGGRCHVCVQTKSSRKEQKDGIFGK